MASRFPFAPEIRAVLFDAGNTLMGVDHARIASIFVGYGVATDAQAVRDAEMRARPAIDAMLASAERREGRATVRRSVDLILAGVGATLDAATTDRVHADLAVVWHDLWTCTADDARPTLDALAARGFALGVVSNADGNVHTRLEAAGLASALACIVDSGREGVEKPDPRLFLRAAGRLGVKPSQCAYVGDLRAIDVGGARAAGMHGILLDPIGAWPPCDAPRVTCLAELVSRL